MNSHSRLWKHILFLDDFNTDHSICLLKTRLLENSWNPVFFCGHAFGCLRAWVPGCRCWCVPNVSHTWGAVVEECRAFCFGVHEFESYSGHCVVLLGKTLCSDSLSPFRCTIGVPDPVQDWGRQRQQGRGDWRNLITLAHLRPST